MAKQFSKLSLFDLVKAGPRGVQGQRVWKTCIERLHQLNPDSFSQQPGWNALFMYEHPQADVEFMMNHLIVLNVRRDATTCAGSSRVLHAARLRLGAALALHLTKHLTLVVVGMFPNPVVCIQFSEDRFDAFDDPTLQLCIPHIRAGDLRLLKERIVYVQIQWACALYATCSRFRASLGDVQFLMRMLLPFPSLSM